MGDSNDVPRLFDCTGKVYRQRTVIFSDQDTHGSTSR
jgi:hypothetical protein